MRAGSHVSRREGSIVFASKTKHKTKHHQFCRVLLICCLFAASSDSVLHAESVDSNCARLFKDTQQQRQQVQSEFSTCRSAKFNELENFNAKRARYMRLITWASNLEFAGSLKPYIDALNERDQLLTSKAEEFEACVPPLRDISVAVDIPVNGDNLCDQPLADIKNEIGDLTVDWKTCQACSLGTVGEGINKSAMEILIAQQKDARVLRQALVEQFTGGSVGDLSGLNQWLITRDVFLAYVTDTALQLSNTQKLIVMLEHLEKTLESMDARNEFTDKVVEVYGQLANTLQSKAKNRLRDAERLWQMFSDVVPDIPAATPARYAGFDGPVEMTRGFNAMSPQERATLASAISAAVKKYQPYHRPS